MPGIIYTRVSSVGQAGLSLDSQEDLCRKHAQKLGIQIRRIHKEVGSSFSQIPPSLRALAKTKKAKVICADITRFSRSVARGMSIANQIIEGGGMLFLVLENLTYDGSNPAELKKLLVKAEQESRLIGQRIKRSHAFLRSRGVSTNGRAPYGQKIINGSLVVEQKEVDIISFINVAREKNFDVEHLNQALKKIVDIDYPIEILYEGYAIDKSVKCLTFQEIAILLNEYGIKRRNKPWNAATVRYAYHSYKSRQKNAQFSMTKMVQELPAVEQKEDEELFKEFCLFKKYLKSKKNK